MKREYYKYFEEDLIDKSLDKSQKPEDIKGRLVALFFAAAIVFSVLLGRLWFMQVINGESYAKQADTNRRRVVTVEAPRGYILDRNGKVVVANRPGIAISLLPTVVQVNKGVVEKLASITGMSTKEIYDKLKAKNVDPLKPKIIKRDVDKKTVAYISEHQSELPGVELTVETIREYTLGNLAAHVIGYLGEISEEELNKKKEDGYEMGDVVGKTGVEKTYEWALRGTKGSQQVEVNAVGRPLRVLRNITPNPGHNLKLTLDVDLQATAEKALAEVISAAKQGDYKKADAGAAVVMNPRTGEVLAMASYPTYDPRVFLGGISSKDWAALTDESSGYPLNNRAIMSAYPPGSTFKMITGIAGLEEGMTTPQKLVNDPGSFSLGPRWVWGCWGVHGTVDFIAAVAESCDTYFYTIGYEFYKQGRERLQYWAKDVFKLGRPTGIDLTSEAPGRIPTKQWKKEFNKNFPEFQAWYPGDTINMSIGQGDVLLTPLQLATVYSAVANGGRIFKPHVVKSVENNDGKTIYDFKPKIKGEIKVDPENLALMRKALEEVVVSGTGSSAFAGFPIRVSGKTGSSEVQGKDAFAWFVGYAPSDDPQYVAAVVIEQGGHGGSAAAPVVRSIFAKAFNISEQTMIRAEDLSR